MIDRHVTICAVGLKGAVFIENVLARGLRPHKIISYDQPDDYSLSFSKISELAQQHGIAFVDEKRPALSGHDLSFLVGWQFLVASPGAHTIVFHDSLLPRYRGFAPTVGALINGDSEIGVTAIKPNEGIDEGDVVAQKSVPISYPITIARALEIQAKSMAELAIDIHADWLRGSLSATKQNDDVATYSIWRDELDHIVDWSWPAGKILRLIHAVGSPYSGARTFVDGNEIVIDDAAVVDDLRFEQRDCGKVWKLDAGRPVVVCGEGLLRLDAVRKDGQPYRFHKLRQRLGYRKAGEAPYT